MSFNFDELPNKRKAEIYRRDYSVWKSHSLSAGGYFPIFSSFKDSFMLSKLSGNALKLYIFLGLASKNDTGDCWVSIDTIAKYFNKSNRAISGWIKELEDSRLIIRMQMEQNGVAHTFIRPYY